MSNKHHFKKYIPLIWLILIFTFLIHKGELVLEISDLRAPNMGPMIDWPGTRKATKKAFGSSH